jgi:hypothetical protein
MTRAKRSLFLGALAAAIIVSAGPRIASARASGPPQGQDLAAGITAYATSEVNAAMADSTAVFSDVVQVEVSSPAPASSAAPSQNDVAPQASAAGPDDATTAVSAGSVEITAALSSPALPAQTGAIISPTPIEVAVAPGEADSSLRGGAAAGHDLERLTLRSKSAGRARGKIVVRSTSSLRVDVHTSTTGTGVTSFSVARAVTRSTVRSTVKSSASGGGTQRPAPKAPLPFPPFPPNAPAPPSSGTSSTGGGGGQGALLTFSVVLAALMIVGIHRLLRRVHWSGLRMPGRGAALPWRPG